MNYTEIKRCQSHPMSIFIAGEYADALMICRSYCDEIGFCVTVTPTTYVYRGGQENGVIIGLINYPRFPEEGWSLYHKAFEIGEKLMIGLKQQSFCIQTATETKWFSCG